MIGFLPVDKPAGWTSHDVVAKVRKLIGIKKVGHAGTLDPMATGLVVLGVGRATKLLRFVQDLPKEYVARVKFGIATDSLDADGAVVSDDPMPISRSDLESVIPRFVGAIEQVPPMVSAIKVDGRRLHELARQGVEVERKARRVEVSSFEIIDFDPGVQPEATVRVRCGKGTYVRVLGDDLAKALGGRAHLVGLRRLANGSLTVTADALTLEEIEQAGPDWPRLMMSPADALRDLPAIHCEGPRARLIANGRRFDTADFDRDDLTEGTVYRMLDASSSDLIAVYRVAGNLVQPEVVLA